MSVQSELRKLRVQRKKSLAKAIKHGAELAARKWAADNGLQVEVLTPQGDLWIQFMVREYLFGEPRFFEVAIKEQS